MRACADAKSCASGARVTVREQAKANAAMNQTHYHPRRPRAARRQGVTALLAMLYLVLISSLAIGFYAATTTQSRVSDSEERVARSYLAADSGLDFMRRVLAKVYVTPHAGEPDYPSEKPAIDQLYDNLSGAMGEDKPCCLDKTPNLAGNPVKKVGNVIYIPGDKSKPIKLDTAGDAVFTATITEWAGEIVCKIQGKYGGTVVTRAISLDFT